MGVCDWVCVGVCVIGRRRTYTFELLAHEQHLEVQERRPALVQMRRYSDRGRGGEPEETERKSKTDWDNTT